VKVALVIEHFDRSRGGAEVYISYLAARLVARGEEVHIFARDASGFIPGAVFHPVPVRSSLRTRQTLSFARIVDSLLREGNFDIIHSVARNFYMDIFQPHGGTVRGSLMQNIDSEPNAARRSLKKIAAALSPRHRLFLSIERRQFSGKLPLKIIAVSEMVRSDMMRFYGVPEERISVIYNGADTRRFHPGLRAMHRQKVLSALGIPEDSLILLFVAHNFRLKGLFTLVRAAGILKSCRTAPVKVLVVGRGRRSPFARLAKRLGVADDIFFLGPAEKIERYYGAADIYVQPTFYDPCSLVVLEALASGLPVITSRRNGVSELIKDGVEGFVMEDPSDARSLADFIVLLSSREKRRQMAEAARILAERESLEKHFELVVQLYDEVRRAKERP